MAKHAVRKRKQSGVRLTRERPLASGDRVNFLIATALAIVTLAIYAQVIGHQFITLDDDAYITDNPMVNRGITLAGLAWAFTTFHEGNWHPLTWISHMIAPRRFAIISHARARGVKKDCFPTAKVPKPWPTLRRTLTRRGSLALTKLPRQMSLAGKESLLRCSVFPHTSLYGGRNRRQIAV